MVLVDNVEVDEVVDAVDDGEDDDDGNSNGSEEVEEVVSRAEVVRGARAVFRLAVAEVVVEVLAVILDEAKKVSPDTILAEWGTSEVTGANSN